MLAIALPIHGRLMVVENLVQEMRKGWANKEEEMK